MQRNSDGYIEILDYHLVETCGACPEQYDVFSGTEQVGYLRLRHGQFAAHANDASGVVVFESEPNGDGLFDDDEREWHLTEAVLALIRHHVANWLAASVSESQKEKP